MKIFPIGDVAAASNQGTINGVSYSMFEPNESCRSHAIHNILQTQFSDQTLVTRKKSAPYLQVAYEYNNIFTREFRQVERAVRDVEETLTPLYVVDFSRGITPSAVASAGAKWTVSIDDTYFYSATAGYKANRAFLWDGRAWKEGTVDSLTLNASITVDIQTSNYGALPLADAPSGLVYPLYEMYIAQGAIKNFKTGAFWRDDPTSTSRDGGYMYSGNVNFISRFKV